MATGGLDLHSTARAEHAAVHVARLAVHRVRVIACLAAVYLIWGSAYLAIRVAVHDAPPFLMAGSRFMLAGILLYSALRLSGAVSPDRRQWIAAGWTGLLMVVAANGGVVFAEQWVDSGITSIVLATSALWAALFAGIWERWPSRPEWIGLTIGFSGVVLLNAQAGLRAHPMAALSLVFAALTWSLGSILSRHAHLPPGLMAGAAQMLTGGAVMLLIGTVSGEWSAPAPSADAIAATVYLGIFSSLVGFSAFTWLIHNTRPALAFSYSYINPTIALGLGAVFLGEKISLVEIVAMLLTVSAILFILQGRGHHRLAPVRLATDVKSSGARIAHR
jgi:drug/metabolite transporter (DMT)-like permease